MADSVILFWHRRDLRITDNVGLTNARKVSPKVVGVFCLDPNILERDDVAPARMAYALGSLQELQDNYARMGSQLLILQGQPDRAIPSLAVALGAKAVYWNSDVEPYSKHRDRKVEAALQAKCIEVNTFWDQLLLPPGMVITGMGKPYTVYTPFWKNWSRKNKAAPMPELPRMAALSADELAAAHNAGAIARIPTAKDLGFIWDWPLVQAPGERAAQLQLEDFCRGKILAYDKQRDFPDIPGTSQLSAALKFGVIGIRNVWAAIETAWNECRSDEARLNIRTWQQELAWREFYQHIMYYFPELADGPYRAAWKNFSWDNNSAYFQAWCEGLTGYPIVDAAMRQLNETGWMHNRCRMIVASFLTKDLIINWQWGEKYFMQTLIDGDLSANNGGWQWTASSGMDPKPIRIFNPASQAKKFDPDAEYILHWLPELSRVDPKFLITGKIPADKREAANYPEPIVDHQQQQQKFKQLYQQSKMKNADITDEAEVMNNE
jgi:deoxyribodipyrimidine photo-lyase